MKIAIAQEDNQVAPHFGRCPHYTLVDIAEGQVVGCAVIPNPGHEPGFLPGFLAAQDVNCIIAGGMGHRAVELFRQQGIQVLVGATGSVDETIARFLRDELVLGSSLCAHESPVER